MASSGQTPNSARNGTRTPSLATHGTQNNFRDDGRDEGTIPFNRNGTLLDNINGYPISPSCLILT